ncbi:MAG: hypothetical protein QOK05_417 [Chloroflexota bacterium]|jgi:MFS family permease|nr:hypothetical protein [Chloroflexota bacterium]
MRPTTPVPATPAQVPQADALRIVGVCALASLLSAFGGSILFVALPAIGAEFHAGTADLARLGATLSVGSAIALPLAFAADRAHRGRLAALGIAGFSLAALATAASPGVSWLAGARLFAVCFETLVSAVALAAALEAVGPDRRAQTAAFLALSAGAGVALSVLGYPLVAPRWRLLYLAAAPGLLLAPLALGIPGRARGGPTGLGVLVAPPWRRRLLVLAASSALGTVLYEPANFFAVFFGSRSLGLTSVELSLVLGASGVAAALGFVLGGAVSDRLGRRVPSVMLGLASAVLAAVSFSSSAPTYIGAGIAWSAVAGAAGPMVGAWIAELMPARARVTAFTATGVSGALGGVLGLQLVAALSGSLGLQRTIWVTAIVAGVGAVVLLALPETRGRPLPD